MQDNSPQNQFTQTLTNAEELIYEAVNAFCHGNIRTSCDTITRAINTIEFLQSTSNDLDVHELCALKDVTTRAQLVRADIKEQTQQVRPGLTCTA